MLTKWVIIKSDFTTEIARQANAFPNANMLSMNVWENSRKKQ